MDLGELLCTNGWLSCTASSAKAAKAVNPNLSGHRSVQRSLEGGPAAA